MLYFERYNFRIAIHWVAKSSSNLLNARSILQRAESLSLAEAEAHHQYCKYVLACLDSEEPSLVYCWHVHRWQSSAVWHIWLNILQPIALWRRMFRPWKINFLPCLKMRGIWPTQSYRCCKCCRRPLNLAMPLSLRSPSALTSLRRHREPIHPSLNEPDWHLTRQFTFIRCSRRRQRTRPPCSQPSTASARKQSVTFGAKSLGRRRPGHTGMTPSEEISMCHWNASTTSESSHSELTCVCTTISVLMKEQAERNSGAWRQGNAAARLLQSAATRTSALELDFCHKTLLWQKIELSLLWTWWLGVFRF